MPAFKWLYVLFYIFNNKLNVDIVSYKIINALCKANEANVYPKMIDLCLRLAV